MKLSNDRRVLIADDIEMFDAAIYGAPPVGVQVLCCNAKLGTTVKGIFDPAYHDCWYPLPRIPMSAKKRAYGVDHG